MPISDWSSDVCSSDLRRLAIADARHVERDQRWAQFARVGEAERQRRIVGQRGDRLQLGERLGARLRLFGGRGAGRIARDIVPIGRASGRERGCQYVWISVVAV